MFGVVPRVLWERVCPPDESNRISMNMNCVFVDTGKDKILIETGIGEKWTDKQISMYGIFRDKSLADSLFEISGCRPDDITIVVNTHLHFDHAGGNTILSEPGAVATGAFLSEPGAVATGAFLLEPGAVATGALPQFQNARYLVSASELDAANNPHERDRASYLNQNWQPLVESGQLEIKPDDYEVVPGLKLQTIRGHSQTMQTWRLDRGDTTVYGFADLIPTRHHLALPWIMGYDLYPTETLEFKKRVLPQALAEKWLCVFYHDIDEPLRRLETVDGKLASFAVN